MSNVVKAVF